MSQEDLADLEAERAQACNFLLGVLIASNFSARLDHYRQDTPIDEAFVNAMKLFHPHEDYLHLMPKFVLEMLDLAKPHGEETVQSLIHWSGVVFADLLEFTHHEND